MLSESDKAAIIGILGERPQTASLAGQLPFLNPTGGQAEPLTATEDAIVEAVDGLLDFALLHGPGLVVAAQEILQVAIKRWPSSGRLHLRMAQTHAWLKDPARERKSLEMALMLYRLVEQPDDGMEKVERALERLNKGTPDNSHPGSGARRSILRHLVKGVVWLGLATALVLAFR
ncbi:MAG: hypothetical protein HZC25_08280 [Rhodospirillales bacterium]|nr:hypothetical protein [Rhodospirillales bacterium]